MSSARPESIPGYEPPTQVNTKQSGTLYRVFDEGSKSRKIEQFDITDTAKPGYAAQMVDKQRCPVCEDEPVFECNCIFADKRCKLGHVWYTKRTGEVLVSDPHHTEKDAPN